MIQKGDKYLCKCSKDFKFDPDYKVIEGTFYEICSIEGKSVIVHNGKTKVHFVLDYVDNTGYWYFYNAFYTKQEEREIKLKKINNIS